MSEKTLKFNNIRLNKNKFHKSKEQIELMSVIVYQTVVSDKFKHNNEDFKYFIGYQEGEIVKPLFIILSQMSGYIKSFENGVKNMSFMIKDSNILDKYNNIWDKIKEPLSIKFHSKPVYDQTYIKVKVREFDGKIKTNLLGNKEPKENIPYTSTACITIDSVMEMDKKNYPQIYLEECKYRVKKMQTSRFINAELESDSDSKLDSESKSDTKLMEKLKSDSDNDSE